MSKKQVATVYDSTYRLRAGPYVSPEARIGDTLKDEWASEKVAGFTEAPIPWPACIHKGKLIPILTGDLVRAILEEPEGAVAYYFGVTQRCIKLWKQTLSGKTATAEIHVQLALMRRDPEVRRRYYKGI